MGRVLTNNTNWQFAIEQSLGVLPGSPSWKQLEPNAISAFGAAITTVARTPISQNRQRRKGTITDLDATVELEADLTLDLVDDFYEGFLFSVAVNKNLQFLGAPAVASTNDYTVPALSALQAGKLHFNSGEASLLWAQGYVNAANNGLRILNVQPASTDTILQVGQTLVAETAPSNARIEIAGIRCLTNSDLTITRTAGSPNTATIVSAAALNFTTYGLTLGQYIHLGGLTSTTQPNSLVGFGRIIGISATTLTLDKLSGTLATGSSPENPAKNIDILFGTFCRNVPVSSAEFLERSYQFEGSYPNLFETTPPTPVAEPDGYEYALGQFANQMTLELPLADKATATISFVGTDVEPPVDGGSRKANADTPRAPSRTEALNTSADIARLRVTGVDESGLTTDFKSLTLTIANNVTPEKVLGLLGARFLNFGTFEVSLETSVLFTSPAVIAAIRANTTVALDALLRNNDGGVFIDIPNMTLGDGAREFPANETVLASLSGQAFGDSRFNISMSMSTFPVLPTT